MFRLFVKKKYFFYSLLALVFSTFFISFLLPLKIQAELEPFGDVYDFSQAGDKAEPFQGLKTLFGSGEGDLIEIDPEAELEKELKEVQEGDLGPDPAVGSITESASANQAREEAFQARSPITRAPDGRRIISKIDIVGNRLVLDEEVMELVRSQEGTPLSKRQVVADLKSIYSMGFFDKDSIEAKPVENDDGSITLEYHLKENPPITDIEVYGGGQIKDIDAFKIFSDLVGKPENISLLTYKIHELENEYLKEGYIIARVKDIDLEADGTLKLYLDEGVISELQFTGNNKTKEKFLRYLVTSAQEGQPYNEKQFLNDFKRIQGTGYYSTVSRTVIPDMTGEGYVLDVQLEEKKTTSIGVGGGVNSSAGLFGNLNATVGNLRGMGETLNVSALLGSGFGADSSFNNNSRLFNRDNVTQFSVNYSIPYYKGSTNTVSYFGRFLDGPSFMVDLADQRLVTLGSRLTKPLNSKNSFNFSASINDISLNDDNRQDYIDEITDNIAEDDGINCDDGARERNNDKLRRKCNRIRDDVDALRDGQLDDGFFFKLGANYSFVDLDNPRKPRSGWKTRFGLQPHLSLGDVGNFTKLNASATRYTKIGRDSTFVLNARTGYELLGDIPQFAQFRLGGNGGIRGYRQFSDLGIGTEFLIGTAEYRTPIYNVMPPLKKFKILKDIDLALFTDAGVIGGNNNLNDISNRLNRALSVGIGLRVNLPLVGGLRLDIGYPLVKALDDNSSFRFNFGVADPF